MRFLSVHQSLWMSVTLVFAALYAGDAVTVDMDFVQDCCQERCGTMNSPFLLASGLDKTNNSRETLYVSTIGNETDLDDLDTRLDDDLCLITVHSSAYTATMNLSFYLKSGLKPTAVIVLDSLTISPTLANENNDERPLERSRRDLSYRRSDNDIPAEAPQNKGVSTKASLYNTGKHYVVESYRIRSGHQITIAVPVKHIRNKNVHLEFASFAADKGTSGVTFFISLGVVFGLFIIGVPASLLLYRRYRRNKKRLRITNRLNALPVVHYDAIGDRVSDGSIGRRNTESPSAVIRSDEQLPKFVVQGLVRNSEARMSRRFSLPAHELLVKQRARQASLRPVIIPSTSSRTEYLFPGVEPGQEGEEPPCSVLKTRDRTSRGRVVSHLIARQRTSSSTEDLCKDSPPESPM